MIHVEQSYGCLWMFILLAYVIVKGRNQTLFTLSTFEKKSSKGRKFYCKASVMTKVNFD